MRIRIQEIQDLIESNRNDARNDHHRNLREDVAIDLLEGGLRETTDACEWLLAEVKRLTDENASGKKGH
jgi:hypothetical protein